MIDGWRRWKKKRIATAQQTEVGLRRKREKDRRVVVWASLTNRIPSTIRLNTCVFILTLIVPCVVLTCFSVS